MRVLGADDDVALQLIFEAADPLVDELTLQVRVDRFGAAAEQARSNGRIRIRNRIRRARIEVVAEALDFATERPDVDVHRDALVEAAPVRVDLAAVVARHVPDEADAWRPVLIQLERGLVVAVADVLAFPADAAVDREDVPDLPAVLRVERNVARVRLRGERQRDRPRGRVGAIEARRSVVDVEAVAIVDDAFAAWQCAQFVDALSGAAVVVVVDRRDVLAVDRRP